MRDMRRFAFITVILVVGMLLAWAEASLEEAERIVAIQAEIATRAQAAHLDLELARVSMRVARGELTPAQGDELRAELRREYGGK